MHLDTDGTCRDATGGGSHISIRNPSRRPASRLELTALPRYSTPPLRVSSPVHFDPPSRLRPQRKAGTTPFSPESTQKRLRGTEISASPRQMHPSAFESDAEKNPVLSSAHLQLPRATIGCIRESSCRAFVVHLYVDTTNFLFIMLACLRVGTFRSSNFNRRFYIELAIE